MQGLSSARRILAIDTAMGQCAACLLDLDSGHSTSRVEKTLHGHAGTLVPMIEEIMKDSGESYDSIGLIAVTTGPGSFTGIRVGLSCARGLALALDIPVRGFSTMEVLAGQFLENDNDSSSPLLVLIETRRDNLFVRAFDPQGRPCGEPQDSRPEDIVFRDRLILLGDGAARLRTRCPDFATLPCPEICQTIDTAFLARLAAREEKSGAPPRPARPLYIRPADVYGPQHLAGTPSR